MDTAPDLLEQVLTGCLLAALALGAWFFTYVGISVASLFWPMLFGRPPERYQLEQLGINPDSFYRASYPIGKKRKP